MQKDDQVTVKAETDLDRIRGSLIGGAVGDALGYAVEFIREKEIFARYGSAGITSYDLDHGKAIISDDTQMTLFTANGLLVGDTVECTLGKKGFPREYVARAYVDWYRTQTNAGKHGTKKSRQTEVQNCSWLLDVPELFALRAPGNTCLDALSRQGQNTAVDYISHPVNNSKGCGGVMRVAPMALRYRPGRTTSMDLAEIDKEGAQLAAITHGHSLGYMPAAVLVHVISRILTDSDSMSLREIILEARDTAAAIFAGDTHLQKLISIIDLAVALSENDADDLDNIHRLGEGWVAEETLGISLYCALKYQDDFSKAIIVSVNHKGDSDSTGAVTGNIAGALHGYGAIPEKWKKDLELRDVILEMADDLCYGCPLGKDDSTSDPVWERKYIQMHR